MPNATRPASSLEPAPALSPRVIERALPVIARAVRDPDARQFVILRLLEQRGFWLDEHTPPGRVGAWARMVARNHRLSLARDRLAFEHTGPSVEGSLERASAPGLAADAKVYLTEFARRARAAIEAWHRRGLALFDLQCEGAMATSAQLAAALGTTVAHVDKLRQRNRAALRRAALTCP